MVNIYELTSEYVKAFDSRDLVKIEELMSENFSLTDPTVANLQPKSEVLNYIKSLFDGNDSLSFHAHQIIVDGNVSVIHFTLSLGEIILDGVDVIVWQNGQLFSMHAYLTERAELNIEGV